MNWRKSILGCGSGEDIGKQFEKIVNSGAVCYNAFIDRERQGGIAVAGKKTKVHKKVDGRLLQMNKTFNNLKMKQKDKITGWVYEEYKGYVMKNERIPDTAADVQIIGLVLDKIEKAGIWIPDGEIVSYYH